MMNLTDEQFILELNTRVYTTKFRMAAQEKGQTYYEFIKSTLGTVKSQEVASSLPKHEEISKNELINRIEELGRKHYDALHNPKHIELINTIRPQWGHNDMSEPARNFAMKVLAILENYEENSRSQK